MNTNTPETSEYNILRVLYITRRVLGITQVQLSKKTGVAQCDISRIETGRANTSIKTIKRLAAGMGMRIRI